MRNKVEIVVKINEQTLLTVKSDFDIDYECVSSELPNQVMVSFDADENMAIIKRAILDTLNELSEAIEETPIKRDETNE